MRASSEPPDINRPLPILERSPTQLTDTKRPKLIEGIIALGDQQLGSHHVQDRHLFSAYLDSEELSEYQTIMATMAQEVSDNLQDMSENKLPWTSYQAHWTIPGPFKENRKFYFDLTTGDAIFAWP
eukprot:7280993-Pyramimonas_sp.AAC.1